MGTTRFHWGITRVHTIITSLHRGITIIHSSAARWRRRRIGNPVHAAFIKGVGDNLIYMLSYVIAKMKIFIPLRITATVRQTTKDTEFNYFLCYSTLNCKHFGI